MFYYNNLGDDALDKFLMNNLDINSNLVNNKNIRINKGLFNILVLGRPGTGKSTLINILSDSKRCLEGRGGTTTKNIIKCIIEEYNICLYDTPGFELDKDINNLKNYILKLQNHLLEGKNQINLVFYLISNGARDIYENEKKILKILMENDIPTFFLLTFSKNLEKGNEFKEIIEISIRRALKKINKDKAMEYYKNKVRIYPVHLLDEPNGSCYNFGLKTVLEKVYQDFL